MMQLSVPSIFHSYCLQYMANRSSLNLARERVDPLGPSSPHVLVDVDVRFIFFCGLSEHIAWAWCLVLVQCDLNYNAAE